ncbi:MAG: hypothetical protein AAGA02_05595 [Bacteroidota bacterium]
MYKSVPTCLLLIIFAILTCQAQEVKVNGYFEEDSIKLGIPTPFVLTASYPSDIDIVFPDSLFNFDPYELDSKWYTPTRTIDNISYDSAVYYLTSFEIDSVQYHQMPVFQVLAGDSLIYSTINDSILFQHVVTEIPDSITAESIPLKENTTYKRVNLAFNYPYFIIGAVILIILLTIIILVFGKSIKRSFLLRKLGKGHRQFMTYFESVLNSNKNEKEKAEAIILSWKKYLEKLENRPYTKSTTKEIIANYKFDQIEGALKGIDMALYAPDRQAELSQSFQQLKDFSQQQFESKIEEVKNG